MVIRRIAIRSVRLAKLRRGARIGLHADKFINKQANGVTDAFLRYARPLIGELPIMERIAAPKVAVFSRTNSRASVAAGRRNQTGPTGAVLCGSGVYYADRNGGPQLQVQVGLQLFVGLHHFVEVMVRPR